MSIGKEDLIGKTQENPLFQLLAWRQKSSGEHSSWTVLGLASLVWQLYWPLITVVKENHGIYARLVGSMLRKHIWADCALLYHMPASFNFRFRNQNLSLPISSTINQQLGTQRESPEFTNRPQICKRSHRAFNRKSSSPLWKRQPPKKRESSSNRNDCVG